MPEADALEGTFVGSLFFEGGPLLAGGYVAKGEGKVEGAIWASDDGRSWTRLTGLPGFEDGAVGRISRGPDGAFLAVGSTCYYECSGVRIWSSTDGAAWTPVDHDLPDSSFITVIPGGPGWIGLGEVNLPLGSLAGWTSADGARWARATGIGPDAGIVRGLEATATGFVAAGSAYPGDDTEPAVWASEDGSRWSRVPANLSPGGLGIDSLAQVGGVLVALARTDLGIEIWTSDTGETWTHQPGASDPFTIDGSPTIRVLTVTHGGPGLIAFGGAETAQGRLRTGVWVSADGVSWQAADDVNAFIEDVEVYDAVQVRDEVLAVGRLPCTSETCVEGPAFWVSPPR